MKPSSLLGRRVQVPLWPLLVGTLLWAVPATGGGRLAAQADRGARTKQATRREHASLEELASRSTPAVVLIDVQTAADSRQGSGVLIDPSGRILTNHHVIRDAKSARVKLSSGDVYDEVQILADDARRDIAVLQIPGFDLPAIQMGNSDSVRIGSPVVLIGSPLGLENTVSTGIVSGRRQEPEGYQLLQVTAPASPGSSGGAVLDDQGEVVGIAVSQMQSGQNLNFAVPINYARGLLANLDGKPITVLRPTSRSSSDSAAAPEPIANVVNQGLFYRLEGFGGYQIETTTELGDNQRRHTRITYRLIETVGGDQPQIERYLESETTRRTEPFGTVQTLRRSRSRSVVRARGLRPISAKGQTSWWNGSGWVSSRYDLEFKNDHVIGVRADTTGHSVELDRDVPQGIVLADMDDLAFALVQADTLVGRSVELSVFDPGTGDIERERYDVRGRERVDVAGRTYPALRVNVARGLDNETLYVRESAPRVFLKRSADEGRQVETLTSLELFPPPRASSIGGGREGGE